MTENSGLILYKFYNTSSYNIESIDKKTLFLSKPSSFNDIYDGFVGIVWQEFAKAYLIKYFGSIKKAKIYFINYVRKKLEQFDALTNNTTQKKDDIEPFKEISYDSKVEDGMYDRLLTQEMLKAAKKLYDNYCSEIRKIKDTYLVACFTTLLPQNNIVMWWNYAEQNKGFCAKYILDGTSKQSKWISRRLKYVQYNEKPIHINCTKLLRIPLNKIKTNTYIKSKVENALIYKNKQWSNEKEIRLIVKKRDLKNLEEKENGVLISFPYLCELYSFENSNVSTQLQEIANVNKIYYYQYKVSEENKELVKSTNLSNNIHNVLLSLEKKIDELDKK